ncbi:MAG TPA: glycoside hydrolase family 97 N-terminal domain-containing protein [Agriterribacter sp.]|nr:glycoside hydrolase family 97 N-terminal domain-containing protein [Agriterribacter sp.]
MTFKKSFHSLFFVIAFNSCFVACKESDTIQIVSPDQQFQFELRPRKSLSYQVFWNDSLLIRSSQLGFMLSDHSNICKDLRITGIERNSKDTVWLPVYGERKQYRQHYNEVKLMFSSSNPAVKGFALRVRACNEGIAFRYEFNSRDSLEIDAELTEFTFPVDPYVWASTRAQSPIEKQKLSQLSKIYERPLLAQLSDSCFVALGEAALIDFARMKFEKGNSSPHQLVASLYTNTGDLNDTTHSVIVPPGPYQTPWRYIMAAESPAQLLQHNFLVLNLNESNKLADVSWIKPGKVIREVTLTTQGGIACVDFAAKHNLQYVEFDAGWYGNEYDTAADATTVTIDPKRSTGPLNLPYVISYGRQKGIGVILYVNQLAMEKQLDKILPLYKSWGVAGVKYGFVKVGAQQWTTWLHEAVRKAAANKLMIDIHDEYRPTGYSRTYPNLMTQEGIRGDEESTPNNMVINTIFTRMIAGAGDQTNCYFAERVPAMGSHASQMAKAVCIYSPWQFLYWYDRPAGSPFKIGGAGGADGSIPEMADLSFYDQLPTVWDDTRVIDGYPGELAIVARKNGTNWYLGAITGNSPHHSSLKLDFLEEGRNYMATMYSDDLSLGTKTNIKIQDQEVTCKSVLGIDMLKQNGLAIIFRLKE